MQDVHVFLVVKHVLQFLSQLVQTLLLMNCPELMLHLEHLPSLVKAEPAAHFVQLLFSPPEHSAHS